MGRPKTTSSHRWGEKPRGRSIVGVALLSVLALVASACGSSTSSSSPAPSSPPAGAKENTAISSGEWPFALVKQNGQPLDTITNSSGVTVPKLVINAPLRIRATVPADVVANGPTIFLEYRKPDASWIAIRKVPVSVGGLIDVAWTPGMERMDLREYRLAAKTGEPPNTVTVVSTSTTVKASGNLEHSINLVNKTSNNLNIKIPLRWDQATGQWVTATVPLSQGEQKTLVYLNPPVGTGFSMIVNRQKCWSGCDDYFVDFTWAPDGFQPCIDNQPHFASGGEFTVTLSDDINGQGGGLFGGWKVGRIQGPLDAPGAATETCTFTTRTRIGSWLNNHPVKGAVIIAAIVVVVVVTVIVTATLLAAAAPAAAAAAGAEAAAGAGGTAAAGGAAAGELATGLMTVPANGAFLGAPAVSVVSAGKTVEVLTFAGAMGLL